MGHTWLWETERARDKDVMREEQPSWVACQGEDGTHWAGRVEWPWGCHGGKTCKSCYRGNRGTLGGIGKASLRNGEW